jgi:hypothetical protein
MKNTKRLVLTAACAAILLLATGGAALAQEAVDYTWTAPTTGSPVDHYVVQHSQDGGTWVTIDENVPSNSYTLTAAYDVEHSIRVAGVDAEGRQGPWSVASEPYTPSLGAPGQPGQPIAVF